ncbi:MAG: hypothetical protein JXQ66_01530 [Campylobacterales bacterium]|nr:hypothetical protein [Campylobacterales bacterium]
MQIEIDNISFDIQQIPRKCPICHYESEPIYKSGTIINYHKIDIAFHCTNCHHMFIGKYKKLQTNKYTLVDTWPKTLRNINFEIKDISPNFVKLYEESICAYDSELIQLAGIGLKKSLEILLKDFLLHLNQNDADVINKYTLEESMENFNKKINVIEISNINDCMKKSECYNTKFEQSDIVRIKALINTISNAIRSQIL